MPILTHVAAVMFEGVGSLTSKSKGVAMYYGHLSAVEQASLPSDYEWWPALAEETSPISASVNPFTGDWSVSSLDFALEASDRVATLLLSDSSNPTYQLAGAISTTATSLDVDITGVTTGDVVWVGDEAMLVGSASGTALTSLTRGYWGTPAQSHEDGAGVYARLPYWRSRGVTLADVEVGASEVAVRWRGLVADIAMDTARITVRCEELLGALAAATVNTSGASIAPGGSRWSFGRLSMTTSRWTLRTLADHALSAAPGRAVLYQVDDALVPFNAQRIRDDSPEVSIMPALDPFGLSGDTRFLLDSIPPDGAQVGEVPVERLHELVGWIRQEGTGSNAQGYTPIIGPALLPFHPISVCMVLLMSTGTGDNGDYDILGSSWSLGVDYLDWSAWTTARDDDPELVIDRLILGWEGEEVNVFDVVRRVLRPFGYYLGVTDDGLLYPARLRMVTEADVDAEDTVLSLYPDGPLVLDRSLSLSTSEVRAEIGALPWREPESLTVRDSSRSTRAGRLMETLVHSLDLSVFDPARVRPGEGVDAAVSPFVGLLGLGLDTAPVLRGRVGDHARLDSLARLDLGAYVRVGDLGGVEDPWLALPDGTRVELDTSARWVGILTERAWDPRNHTYTVGVLLINWRVGKGVKERAPAGVVASTPGGAIVTLTTTGPYGAAPGRAFSVGDEVRITDARGTPADTGTREITGVSDTKINTGTAFDTAPGAGDVVRLALSGSYANNTVYSATHRPYTYLAPNASTGVSDAEDDSPSPDIYGTSLFGGSGAIPNGGAFQAIDADAVESANESAAEPLDSWLEYTLRDNIAELYSRGHQVTWTPLTANAGSYSSGAGHRPYCSTAETSILYVPWLCEAGLAGITLGMLARVSSESNGGADVSGASVALSLELGRWGTSTTRASTDGESPEFQPSTITLGFGATPTPAPQVQNLALWVQSFPGTGTDATIDDAIYGATFITSDAGTLYADTASTRPNANALDLQCTREADGTVLDHIQSQGSSKMAIQGQGQRGPADASTQWLSYIQLRSAEVQQVFADPAYPSDGSLRSNQPVLAEACVSHVVRESVAAKRARPLWIGPKGTRPGDPEDNPEGWPLDYTERHIIHNATDSTTTSRMFDAGIWLDTPNPSVTVLLNVIPTRLVRLDTSLDDTLGLPGSSSITTSQWFIWGVVTQLRDGDADWDDATSLGTAEASATDARLFHWPCRASHDHPALFQHALRRLNGWTYREGQIWRQDTGLVQTIPVTVPVTYDPTSNLPARITVHAEHQSTEWRYGESRENALLDLIVVGASIWEQPR